MKTCNECGNPIADNASFCPQCGAPTPAAPAAAPVQPVQPAQPAQPVQPAAAQPAPQPIQINANGWTVAGTAIAVVLLLLCFIGLVSDSGTFLNRLYTTAVLWHLPLVSIGLLIYGIVCDKKEGKKSQLAVIGIICLVVAFFMSNPLKNTVADAASNAENIVNVGKSAMKSNRGLDLWD